MGSYHLLSRAYPSLQNQYSHLCNSNFLINSHYNASIIKVKNCDIRFKNVIASKKSKLLSKAHLGKSREVSASAKSSELERKKDKQKPNPYWFDSFIPESVRPYAQLTRVGKIEAVLVFSCPMLWSAILASDPGSLPDMHTLLVLGLLSVVTFSIGGTVNDYLDRDIDVKVERTRMRPLARGALTPFQVLSFLGFEMLLGFALILRLNNFSRALWVLSLPFILTYPLMKRITYWPQAYLGLAFNFGSLYGWTAIKGSFNPSVAIPLFLSCAFWTIVFDTIYAHQDKEDDVKVGVKSTALLFGDSTKEILTCFGLASICFLALAGHNADIGLPFYLLLAASSSHLASEIWSVDLSDPADCMRKFGATCLFGATILSGILLGRLFP